MIEFLLDGLKFFLAAFTILMVISGLGMLVGFFLHWLNGDDEPTDEELLQEFVQRGGHAWTDRDDE